MNEKRLPQKFIGINTYVDGVGFGVLGVPCSPRDPRFADSNPVEVQGFFQNVKYPGCEKISVSNNMGLTTIYTVLTLIILNKTIKYVI